MFVQVAINVIREFDSLAGSTFTAFSIEAAGVNGVTLTHIGLIENEWIGLLEVVHANRCFDNVRVLIVRGEMCFRYGCYCNLDI